MIIKTLEIVLFKEILKIFYTNIDFICVDRRNNKKYFSADYSWLSLHLGRKLDDKQWRRREWSSGIVVKLKGADAINTKSSSGHLYRYFWLHQTIAPWKSMSPTSSDA